MKTGRSKFMSTGGLLGRAVLLVLFLVLCDLFGLRNYTSILCGTVGAAGSGQYLSAILGLTYVVAYLGGIVLAPIFVIAGSLLWIEGLRRKM